MNTNSNIPAEKKVVSVEILHLDETGYGPQGKHTRREWRQECLDYFLRDRSAFATWQSGWLPSIGNYLPSKSLGLVLHFDDGSTETQHAHSGFHRHALDFTGHTFTSNFEATSYVFKSDAFYTGATFAREASFVGAKFARSANFSSATFSGHAHFSSAIFLRCSYFSSAIFSCDANFGCARFSWDAYFVKTTFGTKLANGILLGKTRFTKAAFLMDTVFSDSEFNLPLYFIEAVFEGDAMFNSAKFNADVRFFSTQFKGGAFFDSTEFNGDAVKCLGQLKRLTDAYGQVDQALNFNAMELRAMRMQTTPKPKALSFKVVTWLYEKVSDYGRSFAKPLFWYGILICLSALLSIIYSKYSEKPIEEQQLLCKPLDGQPPPLKLSYERAVFEYAMFRAGGLMDFTDTGKQNNAVNCRLFDEPIEPGLMRAWGVFKGIASIALLFLAALGLRNKYRIK